METSSSDLAQLQSAMEGGDIPKVIHAAHSIKGAAVNLRLMEIHEAAKRIEIEARENRLERITEMARTMREKLDQIAETLLKQKTVVKKQQRTERTNDATTY